MGDTGSIVFISGIPETAILNSVYTYQRQSEHNYIAAGGTYNTGDIIHIFLFSPRNVKGRFIIM
jgi:hypothetical protein